PIQLFSRCLCASVVQVVYKKAAGEVLTAKQAPHRPGTAPALGLRAGNDVSPLYRRPKGREVMKRYSFAASLALAVVVVLGLAGPAAAGDQVPFKGYLDGDVTEAFDP